MAGPGGGPSRRSHTKSRKGCKTCKRRHIRCDETFPQCRNCTKHQVRCDYMDNPAAGDESLRISTQANLLWTPEIDKTVEVWRQTGHFPFPDLGIYPQLQCKNLSKTELRLLYHVCSILNEVQTSRTSKLTMWTELMPKFLSMAASYHFVMHAVYAFAANHMAWMTQSTETRNIAFHHAGIALKGLHEAIGAFSQSNADAVLSASLLLSWQSTDWRNWASLMTGTKTVMSHMQAFRSESIFAEYLVQQPISPLQTFLNESSFPITAEVRQEHFSIIQTIQTALQRLQPSLSSTENESRWIEQLNSYMERLRTSSAAQTPEEQFSQLYQLRKLLFWVPVTLLSARKGDLNTLLVLAHFYAVALSLEAVFSDIGTPFLASMAAPPLEEIIAIIQTCQSAPYNSLAQAAALLIDFPREASTRYRARREWTQQQISIQQPPHPPYGLDSLNIDLGNQIAEQHAFPPSLSPAFASSTIHLSSPPVPSSATPRSPFLEVPHSGIEPYGYGSYQPSPSSAYTSSTLASPAFKSEDDASSGYSLTLPGYNATLSSTSGGGGPLGSAGGVSFGGFTLPSGGGNFLGSSGSFSPVGCVPTAVWT